MMFTNANLVTPDGVFEGTVELSGAQIAKVEEGSSSLSGAEDLGGDYLLPGLIELHTDNLEKQIKPRPAVSWPVDAAMLTHDAHVIAAGITTVCDAVCVGMYGNKTERAGFLHGSVKAIREG
ncbi:MAG: alpha-D-ribose 1-methylphosphonate 5-triphosphate diphosphatase, partial [Pseudomonadota bacterium]